VQQMHQTLVLSPILSSHWRRSAPRKSTPAPVGVQCSSNASFPPKPARRSCRQRSRPHPQGGPRASCGKSISEAAAAAAPPFKNMPEEAAHQPCGGLHEESLHFSFLEYSVSFVSISILDSSHSSLFV
jgi:hypothetical protein